MSKPATAPAKERKPKRHTLENKGLPANLDAERFVLGSLFLEPQGLDTIRNSISVVDFHLYKHQRIYQAMLTLADAGEKIDRVTVANELSRLDLLEKVDGLSYLVSLDDGLPQIFNVESYCRIIKTKSALRNLIKFAQTLTEQALSQEDSPETLVNGATEFLSDMSRDVSIKTWVSMQEYIDNYPGGYEALVNVSARKRGIPTGFDCLDEITGGLMPEMVMIVAARPGVGKTAWALNLAENISVASGEPVLYCSLEVGIDPLFDRMLAKSSNVDNTRMRKGELVAEDRDRIQAAVNEIYEGKIIVDDTAGLTVGDIQGRIASVKSVYGSLAAVVIDYVQLMRTDPKQRANNRNDALTFIANDLQFLGKKTKVPMIVLSQLRRPDPRFANKRPTMEELRESGVLEQVAWTIALLHRYQNSEREDRRDLVELIVDKNRMGPRGIFALRFKGGVNKFEDAPDIVITD